MTKQTNEIERILFEAGAIKKGHFLLSSGKRSDHYCQCATLFEQPHYGTKMAQLMAEKLASNVEVDVVMAPAIGGILWGYELARALGVRSIFAERPDGVTFGLRRGFELKKGERVLLAEDVVTTGKSVLETVPLVEQAGAEVVGFCAIADRSKGSFQPIAPFHSLISLDFQTWTEEEDPLAKQGSVPVKPGSRTMA